VLLADRDRLLTALEELETDNALDKVQLEDYSTQRKALLQEGAAVLKQLDELEGKTRAERVAVEDDDLEAMIASRRRERQEKQDGTCHACGKPVQASDKFCPSCGRPSS